MPKISSGIAHKVPSDLKKVITSDLNIITAWNNLTPIQRNEWVCWIISVKKVETRNLHILRFINNIKNGKKRPCCWAGCIHRKK